MRIVFHHIRYWGADGAQMHHRLLDYVRHVAQRAELASGKQTVESPRPAIGVRGLPGGREIQLELYAGVARIVRDQLFDPRLVAAGVFGDDLAVVATTTTVGLERQADRDRSREVSAVDEVEEPRPKMEAVYFEGEMLHAQILRGTEC